MPLFGRRSPSTGTRIFYATDVHGSERTWRKFLNAGTFYKADVLVMGGDVMGKLAIPIIREANGRHRATIHGRPSRAAPRKTPRLRRPLPHRDLGFYHTIMTRTVTAPCGRPGRGRCSSSIDLATERLEAWIELAESRLSGTGIRCYVTGGNDDVPGRAGRRSRPPALSRSSTAKASCVPIDDTHLMISVGNSTPTPWKTPREVSERRAGADHRRHDRPGDRHAELRLQLPRSPQGLDPRHLSQAGLDHRSAGADRQGRPARHARRRQ